MGNDHELYPAYDVGLSILGSDLVSLSCFLVVLPLSPILPTDATPSLYQFSCGTKPHDRYACERVHVRE